jgi:hypothetical protein
MATMNLKNAVIWNNREVHREQREVEYDYGQSNIRTPQRSMKPSYLGYLIELLQLDEWRNESEAIDIAKGKHAIPKTWDEFLKRR